LSRGGAGALVVTAEAEPLLEVEDLKIWFPIRRGLMRRAVGWVRAVDGVSLRIRAGQTHALVGESGCGKTTVGRGILRLVEPMTGSVRYRGRDILTLPRRDMFHVRQDLQMIFQDPMTSLDPRMRVLDIVAEGMRAFGIGRTGAERVERVAAALERVKLDPSHMRRFPHEFSGGQRQRIGVARALAVEPKLIICDEAVSALDVSIQAQMLNLLSDLQSELGVAYLFITHDLSVVRYLADEVSVMYLGQIVEQAPTEALFTEPKHPYTRGLLGAVPSTDPERRGVEVKVLGDVPSPANPPSGCRFHTRCPEVFERCPREQPPLYGLGERRASCFLVEGEADE
jgi:peptide/nickel transport system ATP-binding protein